MDDFAVPGIVLMENAARAVSEQARRMVADAPGRIVVVCGAGNNGGDGYAAGRHLHNAGYEVTVARFVTPRPDSDAATNAGICEHMGINIVDTKDIVEVSRDADLLIDAIFGTGLDRDVTGDPAHLIAVMNELNNPILAVDVPSGMDCESGRELGEAIRAQQTLTFVGLKPGFLVDGSQQFTGTISVGDIGVPRELVAELGSALDSATLPAHIQA